MRIGDVALQSVDDQHAGLRAAPAYLDGVADRLDIARLADDAMIECLAAIRRPLQQLDGAVDGDVFLVAGDQERDRSLWPAAMGGEMIEHGGDRAGDAAFHVDRAAAVQQAAFDIAGKRAVAPRVCVARRHHVGMAGKAQMRRAIADPCVEIVDVGGAGLAEGHAMRGEAGVLQQRLQHTERAGVGRRDRRTAQQGLSDGEGVTR